MQSASQQLPTTGEMRAAASAARATSDGGPAVSVRGLSKAYG